MINLILEKGADIHKGFEMTPLYKACKGGKIDLVRSLLRKDTHEDRQFQKTPLCKASKRGFVKLVSLLLEKGVQVDQDGGRALGLAVLANLEGRYPRPEKEITRLLFKAGAVVGEEFPSILEDMTKGRPLHEIFEQMVEYGMDKTSALKLLRAYPGYLDLEKSVNDRSLEDEAGVETEDPVEQEICEALGITM